ncbi:hypothetical protein ERHA55_52110 (plasmid) [Erwinia rhapontici]|nr:hypothetical protein ERHA55_52110 [Erwinia rhapontici]
MSDIASLRVPLRLPVGLLLSLLFLTVLTLAACFPGWLAPDDPLLADPVNAMQAPPGSTG